MRQENARLRAEVEALRARLEPPPLALAAPGGDGADPEAARLRALRETGLLDTEPEEAFDRLTRLARRLLDVPVAL
ncbi:MAG: hypothetical protein R3362_00920, partial [Rhodothermales bacterium]|nr:hypothetical protein [Rhodothermales bacterium]